MFITPSNPVIKFLPNKENVTLQCNKKKYTSLLKATYYQKLKY